MEFSLFWPKFQIMLEANEAIISKRGLQITLLEEMVKSALVITLLNMSIVALTSIFLRQRMLISTFYIVISIK